MTVNAGATPAVFLYDGDCAFCTRCAQFINRRIPTSASVRPWQSVDLNALGVSEAEADAAVQWVPGGERTAAGPEAIAELLRSSRGVWRAAGAVLARRPIRTLAWPVYRWVARNRHRMPGGSAACSLPQAQRPQGKAQD